jgi:2-polyprenyl-3-methyl-5-hydroxy-6-metoxy-1,4-benzoquinol methylase
MIRFDKEYFEKYYGIENEERKKVSRYYSQVLSNHKIVLDIGCGGGELVRDLNNFGNNVYGTDVSPYAIKTLNKEKGSGVFLVHNIDKSKLPFKTSFFDAVVLMDVVEHLPSPEKAVLEAYRVLKKGGSLLLTTPNSDGWYWKTFDKYLPHDPTHISLKTAGSWVELVKKAGFGKVATKGILCYGFPPGKLLRNAVEKFGIETIVKPFYAPLVLAGTVEIWANK